MSATIHFTRQPGQDPGPVLIGVTTYGGQTAAVVISRSSTGYPCGVYRAVISGDIHHVTGWFTSEASAVGEAMATLDRLLAGGQRTFGWTEGHGECIHPGHVHVLADSPDCLVVVEDPAWETPSPDKDRVEHATEYTSVGRVVDGGGGVFKVLVRRDLRSYPDVGEQVYLRGYVADLVNDEAEGSGWPGDGPDEWRDPDPDECVVSEPTVAQYAHTRIDELCSRLDAYEAHRVAAIVDAYRASLPTPEPVKRRWWRFGR